MATQQGDEQPKTTEEEQSSLAGARTPMEVEEAEVEEGVNNTANTANEQEKLLPDGYQMTDLDPDIYSLIFVGDPKGRGLWFGLAIFCFQAGLVWLVLYDLIDWGNDENPLKIPAGVPRAVSIAQGALMILLTQDSMDLIEALEFLTDGYYEEVLDVCPHAFFGKWLLAGVLHFITGGLILVVIFILLMQETTVFGLGVDFVAMNKFFAVIDNTAFKIAKRGVCSVPLRQECEHVHKVKVRRRTRYTWRRRIRDMLLFGGVMAGYGVLKYRQINGWYFCTSIYVQLGDVFNPGIGEVSGMFDTLDDLEKHDGRAIYQERATGSFRFAYCGDMNRWTLTPYLEDAFEPCGSVDIPILAKSGTYEGYDILATKETWSVNAVRQGHGFQPFTWIFMACNECDKQCTAGGMCDDNNDCICSDGHYGLNCEFVDPCPTLDVNLQSQVFPAFLDEYNFPVEYYLLSPQDINLNVTTNFTLPSKHATIQIENRPVYYAESSDALFLMVFSGRRWLLYATPKPLKEEVFNEIFRRPNFDMINAVYSPIYASDTMDIGTPSDGPTPAGLQWFYVARKTDDLSFAEDAGDDDTPRSYRTTFWVDENQPLFTRLQCGLCDDVQNPCKNFGECNATTRTCTCRKEVGSLCEYEVRCTDPDISDPRKIAGCPFNATCGRDGKCDCPEGFSGNTCQLEFVERA